MNISIAIEKHFTLDKNLPGRDNKFAILPEDLSNLSNYLKLYAEFEKDNGLDYNLKEEISENNMGEIRWMIFQLLLDLKMSLGG